MVKMSINIKDFSYLFTLGDSGLPKAETEQHIVGFLAHVFSKSILTLIQRIEEGNRHILLSITLT